MGSTRNEWLPDQKRLLAVATDSRLTTGARSGSSPSRWKMAVEEILAPVGPFSESVNPQGVAYVCSPATFQRRLFSSSNTRTPKNLTGGNKDRPVLSFQWMSDGEIATLFENDSIPNST